MGDSLLIEKDIGLVGGFLLQSLLKQGDARVIADVPLVIESLDDTVVVSLLALEALMHHKPVKVENLQVLGVRARFTLFVELGPVHWWETIGNPIDRLAFELLQ